MSASMKQVSEIVSVGYRITTVPGLRALVRAKAHQNRPLSRDFCFRRRKRTGDWIAPKARRQVRKPFGEKRVMHWDGLASMKEADSIHPLCERRMRNSRGFRAEV